MNDEHGFLAQFPRATEHFRRGSPFWHYPVPPCGRSMDGNNLLRRAEALAQFAKALRAPKTLSRRDYSSRSAAEWRRAGAALTSAAVSKW